MALRVNDAAGVRIQQTVSMNEQCLGRSTHGRSQGSVPKLHETFVRKYFPNGDVLQLVYRSAALSMLGGIDAGVVLSLALLTVLAVAAVPASSIPAVRATRIEPIEALRYE